MSISMIGIAVPNFVMAPLLSLVLGIYLDLLPTSGWGTGELRYKVLPVIALALPQIAYVARLTRGSMVEVLHSNFVRTARAKGLRERLVVVRHALKGALMPVVSYLGPATAAVMTGSVVIETIFGVPGIGTYRSEEHTSELQSLMRRSYAVFCLKKKKQKLHNNED